MNLDQVKTISCSDCTKSLLHYFVFKQSSKINKILCICPFCNGSSFTTEITGELYYGPISFTENKGYSTVVNSIEENSGVSTIHLIKGSYG